MVIVIVSPLPGLAERRHVASCPMNHERLDGRPIPGPDGRNRLPRSRMFAEIGQASGTSLLVTAPAGRAPTREATVMHTSDLGLNDGGHADIDLDSVLPRHGMRFQHHHHGKDTGGREFVQTNLVSDGFVPAAHKDPNLINPWGVSFSPTSPFWVSDNGTGVTTIYDGTGAPVVVGEHTAITIAPPPGSTDPAAPTGQVFNAAGSGFEISKYGKSAPSLFLFSTEDGTISGWNSAIDAGSSVIAVDRSDEGAVYKGLAMLQTGGKALLYAADFHNGKVDIFDQDFTSVGSFTDPSLPKGYAPFNVQSLDGRLFVTFALQDAEGKDDVPGAGHGFVDEFDPYGHLVQRVASGRPLNSPWGLDIAPAGFGRFGGDLLVGNFGDGTIDAFDLRNDHFVGKLLGADGKPLVIGDLWALTNGNGGRAGDPNTVYFTAGNENEEHGLFGSLSPADQQTSMPVHGMPYST